MDNSMREKVVVGKKVGNLREWEIGKWYYVKHRYWSGIWQYVGIVGGSTKHMFTSSPDLEGIDRAFNLVDSKSNFTVYEISTEKVGKKE